MLFLLSCSPAGLSDADTAKIKGANDAVVALAKRVDALEAANKTLAGNVTALAKEVESLKVANIGLATKADVANTFNNSPIPKEWLDVKTQFGQVVGKTANYESRLAILENKVQLSLTNQQQVTPAWVAANYSTIGRVQTLETVLRAQLADLTARLVSHGW